MTVHTTRPSRRPTNPELIELFDKAVDECPVEAMPWRITPQLAKHILRHNQGNRKLHAKRREYAKAMREGEWTLNGETIIIANGGHVIDGQNRLLACSDSGAEFSSYIVFGIDRTVMPDVNTGKPRSGADALTIAGMPNAGWVAGAARWILLLQGGLVKTRGTFSTRQMQEAVDEMDQDLLQHCIRWSGRVYRAYGQDRPPRAALSALYYVLAGVDRRLADEFFEAMETGRSSRRVSAVDKAMRRIREEKSRASGRLHEAVRLALLVIAWNLAVRGRAGTLSDFVWDKSMDFPEIEGPK